MKQNTTGKKIVLQVIFIRIFIMLLFTKGMNHLNLAHLISVFFVVRISIRVSLTVSKLLNSSAR